MNDYDKVYAVTSDIFGPNPDQVLVDHSDLIDRSAPVLDIGCGQGRNSLFLAREGLQVVALDPSTTALAIVDAAAAREGLPITTVHGGFDETTLPATTFSAICVFGLLQILGPEQIANLTRTLLARTKPGALLLLSAWIDCDPVFDEISTIWTPLGGGPFSAFRHDDGRVRTFLHPNGVLELFSHWNTLHHWEGLGPLHRHGDGPEECHMTVHFVGKR